MANIQNSLVQKGQPLQKKQAPLNPKQSTPDDQKNYKTEPLELIDDDFKDSGTDHDATDNFAHYNYNNDEDNDISESLSVHSYIDENEEKKIELEISNNLSHLTINRAINDNHKHKFTYKIPQIIDIDNKNNDIVIDDNDDDIDDDIDNQQLYNNYPSTSQHKYEYKYKFNIFKEFLGNESFVKYLMFYGTMYIVSRLSLNKYYPSSSSSVSTRVVLISNAIITTFKGHYIYNQPNQALISPFRNYLDENEINYMDIQKAFYVFMFILSYFVKSTANGNNNFRKYFYRLYNLMCIGSIILIKKYKKSGALFIYTTFWSQLSSLFSNTAKIFLFLSQNNNNNIILMKKLSKSLSLIFSLIMMYSRLYLLPKTLIPIIQYSYRNNKQYITSFASIFCLISGYYKTGKGLMTSYFALKH